MILHTKSVEDSESRDLDIKIEGHICQESNEAIDNKLKVLQVRTTI